MGDLDAIIKAAVDDATDTGEVPAAEEYSDEGGSDEGESADKSAGEGESADGDGDGDRSGAGETSEAGTVAADEGEHAEEESGEPEPQQSAEDKEFADILKELGINPKPSGRDNRIPYSRSLRTLVNTVKKDRARLAGLHEKALGEEKSKATGFENELTGFRNLDRLLQTDAKRYLGVLAGLYPDLYGQYAGGKVETAQQTKPNADDPRPGADLKFDDGTVGYSDKQLDALLEWNTRQAVRAANEEFEKRFKPIETDRKAADMLTQRRTEIANDIALAKATFGSKVYDEYEPAIVAAIKVETEKARVENRRPAKLIAIAGQVITNALNEKINKARENAISELKKAPAAASNGAKGASQRKAAKVDDDSPIEDQIKGLLDAKFGANR